MTLPLAVFGNSARNSTVFGTITPGSILAQWRSTSREVKPLKKVA